MVGVSTEDLTGFMPKWLPFPRIVIVRLYAPGVKPIEPNEYRFSVVAVISRDIATIKGLCGGVTTKYISAGGQYLAKHYGVKELTWSHDGKEQHFKLNHENRNSREALSKEAGEWVKQAKKDARLWRELFK